MAAYKAGQYFRQYQLQKQLQPETDDEYSIIQVEDEDGNAIQSSAPTQSNEFPSSLSSKKRKQGPATKTSTSKKAKKFSWTADKAEDLLKYGREYKSACEFCGVDFAADLACMYTEVRRCMARDYPTDFGPLAFALAM